jgi:hypothetical protein
MKIVFSAGICGQWLEERDYFGYDLLGEGSMTSSKEECKSLCQKTEQCNAVTFKPFTNVCWLKGLPDSGAFNLYDWESVTLRLCPEDTLKGVLLQLWHAPVLCFVSSALA